MMLHAPFYALAEHIAIDLDGARAVFTTRRGGVSAGAYATMNLGRFTDDSPAAVERNRASLQRRFGVVFASGRQVHGSCVNRVHTDAAPADPPSADGQATALTGVAPMVLSADCLPIALAGPEAVAMLHAGWRGLAGGLIAEGVRALRELGAGGRLAAAIGPGAGPCCYEVGDEVRRSFAALRAEVRRGSNLDLKAIARIELERAGVSEVHDVEICTICADPTLFFSHRRDRGVTGRQAGFAWLT
jgi:YfiH family protein